jgi:hypothetical protein
MALVYWVQRWFEMLLCCPAVDGMYRILRACIGPCHRDGVLLPPRVEGYVPGAVLRFILLLELCDYF